MGNELEKKALAWMESDEFKTCPRIFIVKAAYIAGAKRGFEKGFWDGRECRINQGDPVTPGFDSDFKYDTYEDALKDWEGK